MVAPAVLGGVLRWRGPQKRASRGLRVVREGTIGLPGALRGGPGPWPPRRLHGSDPWELGGYFGAEPCHRTLLPPDSENERDGERTTVCRRRTVDAAGDGSGNARRVR